MTLPRLISFSGYATAGKDAAADQFVKNDGYVKTYMSKPLEKALLTLDPWIDFGGMDHMHYSQLHAHVGYDESKKNPEVRRLLQKLGTEVGREMFDPDVWIDLVFEEISYLMLDNPVVLTGVRYPNELHAVHSRGGFAVWVDRPGVGPVNTHSSDNTIGPEDCDVRVVNDGSLEDLYGKVKALLKWEGYSD